METLLNTDKYVVSLGFNFCLVSYSYNKIKYDHSTGDFSGLFTQVVHTMTYR